MTSLRCSLHALGLFACINLSAQWTATVLNPPGNTVSSLTGAHADYQGGYITVSGANHAAIWTGTAGSVVDLHPTSGASLSTVNAVSSTQQGGSINATTGPGVQASLWSGSAGSHVNLAPVGYIGWSSVLAMNETQQGGYATLTASTSSRHAALWSGTAGSFVDLHPGGIYTNGTRITAMSSTQQGGIGHVDGGRRAIMWSGTAESVIYLHASGTTTLHESGIYAMTETTQGGFINYGGGDSLNRAAIWFGDPGSRIDLHPTSATRSEVLAMAGDFQAGFVNDQAAVWEGTQASYLNLHSYVTSLLGTDFTRSTVRGAFIDDGALYLVGAATDLTHSLSYAVMWTMAIPEPSSYALLAGFLALGVAAWRRRGSR